MMVHDPTAEVPRCRLQAEDSDEFGMPIYPETAVAEAIREMTEAHLRQTGSTVSAEPIVLRAEYAFCPNLTIIDTPGFILKARHPIQPMKAMSLPTLVLRSRRPVNAECCSA